MATYFVSNLVLKSLANKGRRTILGLLQDAENGTYVSEKTLLSLIKKNSNTEFGKKYNFSNIKSIDDYKKNVPILEYEDYLPYLKSIREDNKENVLTSKKIIQYTMSSGNYGQSKFIPITKDLADLYHRYGIEKTLHLSSRYYKHLDENMSFGRGLTTIEISSPIEDENIEKKSLDTINNDFLKKYDEFIFETPYEVMVNKQQFNTKYLNLLFCLKNKKLGFMLSNFATNLLDILDYLKNNWEMLVADIEFGRINNSISIPDEIRKSLNSRIFPDKKRADLLKLEFLKGFDDPIVPRIWPQLAFVGFVGNADLDSYTKEVVSYIGTKIPIDYLGYSASESIIATTYKMNEKGSIIIPNSGFYEFIPTHSEDCSQTLNMDELEVGKSYEIIVTNLSGLYRYRLHDVIEVLDYKGETPIIAFKYRQNTIYNYVGEKLSLNDSNFAMNFLIEEVSSTIKFLDFSVYASKDSKFPHYIFFIEANRNVNEEERRKFMTLLDDGLKKSNPIYSEAIQTKKLSPCEIRFLKKGTYQEYREMMEKYGYNIKLVKPPKHINNEQKEKFFLDHVI